MIICKWKVPSNHKKTNFKKMKRIIFAAFVVAWNLTSYAQADFYLNPNLGIAWNQYQNSNENITGNGTENYNFRDNDIIFSFLVGRRFENNLILETGLVYHNAENRYHLNFDESSSLAGSSVCFGEGYYCLPINIKYSISAINNKFRIVPYFGITYSRHFVASSPYLNGSMGSYSVESLDDITEVSGSTLKVTGYRTSNNNILLNCGVGLEYQLKETVYITLSANCTAGFRDINRLDVDVYLDDRTEFGEITYKGTKLYASVGVLKHYSLEKRSKKKGN